jgi:hydrogenase-1 operon protein HyaF
MTVPNATALPVLHEIRHALRCFKNRGQETTIDLQSLPFAPGDEERLLSFLGDGEVTVQIDALGTTHIRESEFPGVWVIDHYNPDNQRIALQLEIAETPKILRSQWADVDEGLARLEQELRVME